MSGNASTMSGKQAEAVLEPSQGVAITNDFKYTVTPSGIVPIRTKAFSDALPKDGFTVGDVVEQKLTIPAGDYVDLSSIEICGRLKVPVSTGDHMMPLHGIQAFVRGFRLKVGGAEVCNYTQYNHMARHFYLTRVTDEERNQMSAFEFTQADGTTIWHHSFDSRYGLYNRFGETSAGSGEGVEVGFRFRPFIPFLRKKKVWPTKYSGVIEITINWETDTKAIAERRFSYGHAAGTSALSYTGYISQVKVEWHRLQILPSLDQSMLRQLESGNGFSMSFETVDAQLGNWTNRTGTLTFHANHANVHSLFVYFQNLYLSNNSPTASLITENQYCYACPGALEWFASVGGVILPTVRKGGVKESVATDSITTTATFNARARRTDSLEAWANYKMAAKALDRYDFDGQNNYVSFHEGGLEAAADSLTGVTGTGLANLTSQTIETATKFDAMYAGFRTLHQAYDTSAHTPTSTSTESTTSEIPRFNKNTCSYCIAVPLRTQYETVSGFNGLQTARTIDLVIQEATTRTNATSFTTRAFVHYTAVISCALGRVSVNA